jgi:hypothetical protein
MSAGVATEQHSRTFDGLRDPHVIANCATARAKAAG